MDAVRPAQPRRARWFVFALLALAATAAAAAEPVAKVAAVSGEAWVVRGAGGGREALRFNLPIFLQDLVRTGKGGEVKLLLHDDSVLKVSPQSELRVTEALVGPGPSDTRTTINLLKGKLRSVIGKKLGANSRFEVQTSGAVAGVRGTDFEVLAGERTYVRCYEGVVAVRNADPRIRGEAILTPNTFTVVRRGERPLPPAAIDPGQRIEGQADRNKQPSDGARESGDALLESELSALGEDDELLWPDELTDLGDPGAPPAISETVVGERIYGDLGGSQQQTVVETPKNAVSVPIEIVVPVP